jgi:hypothetical protein
MSAVSEPDFHRLSNLLSFREKMKMQRPYRPAQYSIKEKKSYLYPCSCLSEEHRNNKQNERDSEHREHEIEKNPRHF